MTDQSAQHGQRVDDEMSGKAGAGEDLDPESDAARIAALGPIDEDEHEEILERSELARFVRPSVFPANATALLKVAREEEATEAVLSELQQLPRGVVFPTVAAVWEALGHGTEHRDDVPPQSTVEPAPQAEASVPTDPRRPNNEKATRVRADEPSSPPLLAAVAAGVGLVRGAISVADHALAMMEARLRR